MPKVLMTCVSAGKFYSSGFLLCFLFLKGRKDWNLETDGRGSIVLCDTMLSITILVASRVPYEARTVFQIRDGWGAGRGLASRYAGSMPLWISHLTLSASQQWRANTPQTLCSLPSFCRSLRRREKLRPWRVEIEFNPLLPSPLPSGVADIQVGGNMVKKGGEGWQARWRVGGRERLVKVFRLLNE